ncbi:CRISPR-associated endonuclease Cas1 [Amycolatopsis sp. NPDC059027]|uniref:CRISPR-associated endonuclease Cas1 n=1 Tax=Amycolatopsis sp. NPDC059027 TaxID=3346709 RepID=UPI00366D4C4C
MQVTKGDLVIEDGFPRGSRVRTIPRSETTIKMIIVPSRHGHVTLDVLQWVRDVGIALYVIRDSQVVLASNPEVYRYAAIRRAQCLAADSPTGTEVVRYLLRLKLRRQAETIRMLDADTADWILEQIPSVGRRTIPGCRQLEGKCAQKYWAPWVDQPMSWKGPTKPRWTTFGPRRSDRSNCGRSAVSPFHALINYAYAVLEAEGTRACHVLGLDPLLGLSHRDTDKRPSMVLDLVEPIRPMVDAAVLDWVRCQTFTAKDFTESETGVMRLSRTIHEEVAELAMEVATEGYAAWEDVAAMIAATATHKNAKKPRTPLTHRNQARTRLEPTR